MLYYLLFCDVKAYVVLYGHISEILEQAIFILACIIGPQMHGYSTLCLIFKISGWEHSNLLRGCTSKFPSLVFVAAIGCAPNNLTFFCLMF